MEFLISRTQASVQGLLYRCIRFGSSRRKESTSLDGFVVVLVEGSNKKGFFLSIQLQQGSYIIVPAGRKGVHWWRIAQLMCDCLGYKEGRPTLSPHKDSMPTRSGFSPLRQ